MNWRRDLVDMLLLSPLSLNPQSNQLMAWLIEEQRVGLKFRDETGRRILEWACSQDIDVGLVKYLIEEKKMKIRRDVFGSSCLDISCE